MGTFILKRKIFTVYDDTDQLKRMKDSDILAERRKKKVGYGNAALNTVTGAAGGAAAGVALGLLSKGRANANYGRLMRIGAITGGAIGGVQGLSQRSRENADINQYNDRLEYAQRQARRRERVDWKQNMTTRQGYSY